MWLDFYSYVVVPGALVLAFALLFLALFEPSVAYRVPDPKLAPGDDDFGPVLAKLLGADRSALENVEVFSRGKDIYDAEIAVLEKATSSIHLEAFIFREGTASKRFVDTLTERAKAGVEVRVTLDAFGNLGTKDAYFAELRAAGGKVAWYQPLRWYTLKRYNNRTHRELLIVDGKIAFMGGAGIADWWIGDHGKPPWRDTMIRFEGELVLAAQSVFVENWLAASGEVLFDPKAFPRAATPEGVVEQAGEKPMAFVVPSTPSEARSTRARMLFQAVVASAKTTLRIQTPYFVPDRHAIAELVKACERGVKVELLFPGKWNNHGGTRLASRAKYGTLLEAGASIREYRPSMIHTKSMIVDGVLSILGSTNWDNRSASLNDEANLVIESANVAARLNEDFENDASQSDVVTLETWKRRSLFERFGALFASVFARQE
ncbi:MAG TPA: phospholipase D-like domain-containing protein [Polyangiaceae bacterium]